MPDPFDVFLSSPTVAVGTVYIGQLRDSLQRIIWH